MIMLTVRWTLCDVTIIVIQYTKQQLGEQPPVAVTLELSQKVLYVVVTVDCL